MRAKECEEGQGELVEGVIREGSGCRGNMIVRPKQPANRALDLQSKFLGFMMSENTEEIKRLGNDIPSAPRSGG